MNPILLIIVVGVFLLLLAFGYAISSVLGGLVFFHVKTVVWRTAEFIKRVTASRPGLGTSLLIFAAVCQGAIAAWLVYLVSFAIRDPELSVFPPHLAMFAGGLGAMFLVSVTLRAVEVAQNKAVTLDSRTTGPVVLLLRSFATESSIFSNSLGFFLGAGAREVSEEEEIAELFEELNLGEFVTLARPGQQYQELGAKRVLVDSQDWRARVSELIRRSTVIVYRFGTSDALFWELSEVIRLGRLPQTLFLLPPTAVPIPPEEHYRTLNLLVGKSAYPKFSKAPKGRARFAYFDNRGLAHVVVEPDLDTFEPSKQGTSVSALLTPFLHQLGVATAPSRRVYRGVIFIVTAPAFLVYVFVSIVVLWGYLSNN